MIPKKKSIVVCKLRSDNFKMAYICSDAFIILFSLIGRKCFIKPFLHMLCLQIIRQLPHNVFSQIYLGINIQKCAVERINEMIYVSL